MNFRNLGHIAAQDKKVRTLRRFVVYTSEAGTSARQLGQTPIRVTLAAPSFFLTLVKWTSTSV